MAVFDIGDTVKATSADAVRRLRDLGLHPVLLTGDHRSTAHAVAREVGIDEVVAEVRPEDKAAAVAALQESGRTVAMVGDGVNDAAALVQADLGVAMGTGTAVAIEAGDVTLTHGDLRSAADAIELSRRTLRTIEQNLFWAFAYNVVGIPVAALGLLNPMIAGAAMAASSVCVVTNSLRLRAFEPSRLRRPDARAGAQARRGSAPSAGAAGGRRAPRRDPSNRSIAACGSTSSASLAAMIRFVVSSTSASSSASSSGTFSWSSVTALPPRAISCSPFDRLRPRCCPYCVRPGGFYP